MKISIITICFNSAATIRDTFDSVLAQCYTDIEYIVVDGLSTDNTTDIIKEYEPMFNGRMRWISEKDNGLYDAMNKGIKMATGDVVGILNSDDFYHKRDAVKIIVDNLLSSKAECVYGDVRIVAPYDSSKTIRYYSSKIWRPSLFKLGFMPAHPTFFTYRKNYVNLGYYKTSYKIAADFDLLFRFLHNSKLTYSYIETDLLKMRSGGTSSNGWRSNILLNQEIVQSCKENGIYTNLLFLSPKYVYKIWEYIFKKFSESTNSP